MSKNELELINLVRNSEEPKKVANKAPETNNNEQSPYLEEVVQLLSLLSPSKLNKAVNFLEKLKDSEGSHETASAFRETKN